MELLFPLPYGSVYFAVSFIMLCGLFIQRASMFVDNWGIPIATFGAMLFCTEVFALFLFEGPGAVLKMSGFVFSAHPSWQWQGYELWSGYGYLLFCSFLAVRSLRAP